MVAIVATLAIVVASCDSQTGFSGSVGNTPNGPKLTSYVVTGVTGTPFTATVSDSRSSWTLQGVVPLSMIICNNILPAEIIATKTTNDSNTLSVSIISANHIVDSQSTSTPFGSVMLQVGGTLNMIAPPANPDLRIFAAGPFNKRFQALVEDINTGFVIATRAPTLIFFDTPDGKVDGTFFGSQDFGTFDLNMTVDGVVVATVKHGPDATIREP